MNSDALRVVSGLSSSGRLSCVISITTGIHWLRKSGSYSPRVKPGRFHYEQQGRCMNVGEKGVSCLACNHQQVLRLGESIFKSRCKLCGLKFMEATGVRSSSVYGVGRNAVADLGLAILIEAQTDQNTHKK